MEDPLRSDLPVAWGLFRDQMGQVLVVHWEPKLSLREYLFDNSDMANMTTISSVSYLHATLDLCHQIFSAYLKGLGKLGDRQGKRCDPAPMRWQMIPAGVRVVDS